MRKWRVKIPRRDADAIYVNAYAPYPGENCYVGTMRPLEPDGTPGKVKWCLVHIPTGMRLHAAQWNARAQALAFIQKLSPTADCWRDATGKGSDSATRKCWSLYRAAVHDA